MPRPSSAPAEYYIFQRGSEKIGAISSRFHSPFHPAKHILRFSVRHGCVQLLDVPKFLNRNCRSLRPVGQRDFHGILFRQAFRPDHLLTAVTAGKYISDILPVDALNDTFYRGFRCNGTAVSLHNLYVFCNKLLCDKRGHTVMNQYNIIILTAFFHPDQSVVNRIMPRFPICRRGAVTFG